MTDVNESTERRTMPGRIAIAAAALVLALAASLADPLIGPRGRAALGAIVFVGLVAACSRDLRAVNWRTVGWGIVLQLLFAIGVLKLSVAGVRPGYVALSGVAAAVSRFLDFASAGSRFVFGGLADPSVMSAVFPGGVVFAFTALPTIIFVSSFFSVLYHLGVLQLVVRIMAKGMMGLMRTSGAETLSAAANVFMGQTEAPIIVKPFVPRMTNSEMLALMVGGTATISGGMMVVYIGLGADPIAMLTTSVMAAPCGLYVSKILYPETERPLTSGHADVALDRQHVNVIDAAAAGAADGTQLAVNVGAMLIAFLAFLTMFDYLLGLAWSGLTLARVFSWLFAPVAMLMGIPGQDVPVVADLLGTKLVANEFVAFVKLTTQYKGAVSERTHVLATFALTGFANFGSIGIQLGGIGAMAPSRRGDLARLGTRALFAGFVATLINACIAAVLI